MKINGKLVSMLLAEAMLMVLVSPSMAWSASAATAMEEVQASWKVEGNWAYIQNDVITIVFPANGTKPMFLWWYTKDPNNINVVKYKGLIEYVTFYQPYFVWRHQAEAWRIRECIRARYYEPWRHMVQDQQRLRAVEYILSKIEDSGLHAPYLPFSGCRWELSPPVNVTKGEVKYLSFNFTLVDVPGYRPNLQFAENNIIIRCRFYYTPATEDVEGQYSYTVDAGELKMDLIVKRWEWNIDKLKRVLDALKEQGVQVPEGKAGLALWVNLASINMTKLDVAENDAIASGDTVLTEQVSTAKNMYVEGQRVSVAEDKTNVEDEKPMQNQARERHKFRFERGSATLAGYFKFVPKALIRDPATNNVVEVVNVSASYIAAGAHMRAFLGYPYFGNNTLEHDPSLGLEPLPMLVEPKLVIALLITIAVVAGLVVVVRWRRKTVNVVQMQ